MGGALTVPGNVSPYAEANISKDPLAAKILYESGLDVTMVGLDVTQRSQLTLEDLQAWKNCGTLAGENMRIWWHIISVSMNTAAVLHVISMILPLLSALYIPNGLPCFPCI